MFPTVDATWTGAGGENYLYGACYLNGYLYVSLWLTPAKVIKIDPATMATVDSWTGAADEKGCRKITHDGTYLYVGTCNTGYAVPPCRVIKIDPSTMTKVSRWTGETYPSGQSNPERLICDDTYLYALEYIISGSYKARVTKINKSTMVTDTEWNSAANYKGYDMTLMGDILYVSDSAQPANIEKVNKNTMTTVSGTWVGDDADIEGIVWALTNDGTNIYASTYDWTENDPTRLIKINPSTMATISKYLGSATEICCFSCTYINPYVYMGLTDWSPTRQILQINPTTMTRVSKYDQAATDRYVYEIVAGNPSYIYAGVFAAPSLILKLEVPSSTKASSSALPIFAKILS